MELLNKRNILWFLPFHRGAKLEKTPESNRVRDTEQSVAKKPKENTLAGASQYEFDRLRQELLQTQKGLSGAGQHLLEARQQLPEVERQKLDSIQKFMEATNRDVARYSQSWTANLDGLKSALTTKETEAKNWKKKFNKLQQDHKSLKETAKTLRQDKSQLANIHCELCKNKGELHKTQDELEKKFQEVEKLELEFAQYMGLGLHAEHLDGLMKVVSAP
ncbi:hypothetical protein GQ44DRAFT_772678 [Phaeosphaeriaceae sp. PMI808]|nr:hypothetical protein GQ44DRAFT_772678 [Phaeosphaeriaceae sp. PMI808]